MDVEPEDDQVLADDLWLRDKVVRLLQSYIAPGVIADRHHVYDMIRARRVLRRLGVIPITETTKLEQICIRLGMSLSSSPIE